ncbi:hypothetical protein F5Y05DRAFT_371818 [Hypoxylon sp. FL0543]|nr:hypothetical protein F5Y05DRAFT_371818 [Hypoxylon sp. FL0543]
MLASNRLNALLAMPVPLRLALIGAPSRIRSSQARVFSTSLTYRAAKTNYPDVAAFLIPEFRTAQPSEISPRDLFQTFSIPATPGFDLQDKLFKLFRQNPATFQYGELDFYKLKKNTCVPEVCVLGRSNVGKSSFVNALAGSRIASVSSNAGRTKTMNTYGFGPAPLPEDIAAQRVEHKSKEDVPTHAFHLVDMPGYGHASWEVWGRNIMLYLTKRVSVKGVIVLIDAKVGPKPGDLQLLQLLSSAGKRTAIVLTKADKVKDGLDGLRATCTRLRNAILEIENKQDTNDWPWEKEIFVTAVGAKLKDQRDIVNSTLAIARLAVARLAGLAIDHRPKPEKNKKWSGNVISFEDLQYAPSKSAAASSQTTDVGNASSQVRASPKSNEAPKQTDSPFSRLEQASADGHQGRGRIRPRAFGSQGPRTIARSHARAFHSSATPRKAEQKARSQPPNHQELNDILDDFVSELKFINTTAYYAREMRMKHDRQLPLPPEKRNLLERDRQRQARTLQRRFPRDTARIKAVQEKRILLTEQQARAREEKEQWELREAMGTEDKEPSTDEPSFGSSEDTAEDSEYLTSDKFKAMVTSPEVEEPKKKKKGKKDKKKKKKGGKAKEEQKEEVDEFESKFMSALNKV